MKTIFGTHDQTSYSLIEEDDSIGENRLDKELQMGEAKCAALPSTAWPLCRSIWDNLSQACFTHVQRLMQGYILVASGP